MVSILHMPGPRRGPPKRWPTWVVAILVAALGTFLALTERLFASRAPGFPPPDLWAPIGGVAILAGTVMLWVSDRKHDFVGERHRRFRRLAWLGVGLWWLLMIPVGALAMHASAEVSKERALQVVAAAEEFRAANGRWPDSIDELAEGRAERLPVPTFGRWSGYELSSRADGGLRVSFWKTAFTYSHSWHYDPATKRWAHASR